MKRWVAITFPFLEIAILLKKSQNYYFRGNFIGAISPGNFYSRQRKRNRLNVLEGFEYKYNIDYIINQALSKTTSPCFHQSNWMLDKCKLKYLTNLLLSQYNCTAPWLLAFVR